MQEAYLSSKSEDSHDECSNDHPLRKLRYDQRPRHDLPPLLDRFLSHPRESLPCAKQSSPTEEPADGNAAGRSDAITHAADSTAARPTWIHESLVAAEEPKHPQEMFLLPRMTLMPVATAKAKKRAPATVDAERGLTPSMSAAPRSSSR